MTKTAAGCSGRIVFLSFERSCPMATKTKSGAQPPQNAAGDAPKTNGGNAPPVWSNKVWTGSGTIEVAAFQHMVQGANGEFVAFSIAAKRSWKDGDDYKESRSFRPEDLLPLAELLRCTGRSSPNTGVNRPRQSPRGLARPTVRRHGGFLAGSQPTRSDCQKAVRHFARGHANPNDGAPAL